MSEIKTFEAIRLTPEGWTVLSPWVKALDGKEYRQHCGEFGRDEVLAKYIAAQLNRLSTSPAVARLIEACRGLLTMMDRGPQPSKLDEALTWRENDELARRNALAALKAVEGP